MYKQYCFKTELTPHSESEVTIFTASNGSGYISDNELHIYANYHLIYKFAGEQTGWYMQNKKTEAVYFLGEGAAPSVLIQDIEVQDEEYFNSVLYIQEETYETKKVKRQNK